MTTISTVWADTKRVLRTGDYTSTCFTALHQHRVNLSHAVVDPAIAGYCIDAPDFMAAGAMFSGYHGSPELVSTRRS